MENGDAYALGGAPAVGELAKFELNDFGNAMRLILSVGGTINDQGDVAIAGATLLYLGEAGWIGWNGRFWDLKLGARLAQRIAHQVAANLAAQVPTWCDNGHDKRAAWTFARSAGNAGSITAMLRVAEAYLQVDLDAFDRDPQAITVQNGTLRLERVAGDGMLTRFSPHDPRDRITRMAAVDYDPTATAPIWAEKVAFWQPDPLMAAYLQRLAGYALTGHTHEQIFVIFQGKGRDGKSTYMNALRELWGEYGEVADVRTFLEAGQRGGGDATPDLARLAGDCRMLSVAEPGRGAKLNEAMIKSFTGGAPIVARRLRQDLFAFTPRPKVFMEANSRPVIKGDDEGIWRRIRLVLWEHQLSKDQVDARLGQPGQTLLSNSNSATVACVIRGRSFRLPLPNEIDCTSAPAECQSSCLGPMPCSLTCRAKVFPPFFGPAGTLDSVQTILRKIGMANGPVEARPVPEQF